MTQIILNSKNSNKTKYEINDLTKHAAILGTTGSGKTVMCKVLIEEALKKEIPIIAIDPKGDIGGLGIHNTEYDFRPHLTEAKAKKTAQQYYTQHEEDAPKFKHTTNIYTPKSKAGREIALMPDLTPPKNFNKINKDITTITTLIEPLSDSLVSLAGIKTNKEKIQTLITTIIQDAWERDEKINIQTLIKKIITPDIEEIGSLQLEDFLKEKERVKAASALNLLLSSPSKKIWTQGEQLNTKKLLKKNNLNIFDLRFCSTQQEKQFVVEQILQDLYKHLLEQGGTQKLKYILYIDELAGLLPPPPSNPQSKKLLETLIRQARAFGLGIIVATQNPGDIDYKILGNIGTRFIGKLRTDKDIEKVASATDNKQSELKTILAKVKTGDFFLNNSIRNKNTLFQTRWLYTLHEGPLSEKQIQWINYPETKPKITKKLEIKKQQNKTTKRANKTSNTTLNTTIRRGRRVQDTKKVIEKKELQKTRKNLQELIQQTKKYTDTLKMNIALAKTQTKKYTPHIKITIDTKPYKNKKLPLQGPYTFDLTTKAIPEGNYITKRTWSQFIPEDIEIEKPKTSIKQTYTYAIKDAKQSLKTNFYESKIINEASEDQDEIIQKNTQYLNKLAEPKIERKTQKLNKDIKKIEQEIKENNKKINQLKIKNAKQTAKRTIKKIFANKKLLDKTKEMKYWDMRIKQLKKENDKQRQKINREKQKYEKQIQKLKNTIFEKARTQIKTKIYKPTNKDIKIHTTILLIPRKANKQ